ncbi:hypothetical protein LXL04_034174 [Taraxacum kok-saghyz]
MAIREPENHHKQIVDERLDTIHERSRHINWISSNNGLSPSRPSLSHHRGSKTRTTYCGRNLRKSNSIFRQQRSLTPNEVDVVFDAYDLYDRGEEKERLGGKEKKRGKDEGIVSCLEDKKGGGFRHETWLRVEGLEKGMFGKSTPVFFRRVATVVTKLFNITEPDFVVYRKKDYQQWRSIQFVIVFHHFEAQLSEIMSFLFNS